MGKDLADAYPACRDLFRKADDILGYSLSKLCFEGPAEDLTRSDHCQPAIFVMSVACYRALEQVVGDLVWAGMAGLSLGEWTALHVAGAISFEDTLRILEARGRFMQEACEAEPGGMVSVIGLDPETLSAICDRTGATIANLNSEQQTVLSGTKEAVAGAERLAKEAGAKRAIVLAVAGAFHSPLMAPAAEKLESVLAGISVQPCKTTVLSNVTGAPHGSAAEIKREMLRQVTSSVQWLSCIQWFMAQGVKTYVECGPGRVLSGLIKRIDSGAALHTIQGDKSLEEVASSIRA
jgi:[acyl-carrier-protein] S-malonyltransferase